MGKQSNEGLYKMGVDTYSSVPIFQQLSDQVRYLVRSGQLKPGMRLPAARQLADHLGIHRNTVLKAYVELGRSGIIVSRGNHGTFVGDTVEGSSAVEGAILDLVAQLITEANKSSIAPTELASFVFSQAMSQRTKPRRSIVIVECNPDSLEHYRREIAQAVGVRVQPILLDALESWSPASEESTIVVTTFFHFAEVRRRLRGAPWTFSSELVAINVQPHLDVLQRLNELPSGTRLGIAYVHSDPYASARLRRMHEAISHAHLNNVDVIPLPLTTKPSQDDFAGLTAILVRPENIGHWRNSIPAEMVIIEFTNTLDEASTRLLRQILSEAPRTARSG